MFVDRATVHLRAGAGGAGETSFRRVRGKPKGKPDGGSGGTGGGVIIRAAREVGTLLDYHRRPHRSAGDATHGAGNLRHGKRGRDLTLDVPCGTVVRDAEGVVLADLVLEDQRVTVLQGGRGGLGNAALVSRRHKAPNFSEPGEDGESGTFTLELKLISDAALVGYPNAGKSTLISAVSAAKPKIAEYPFTTVQPHLGVVLTSGREFTLVDVPGLVEGAAEGKGLGRQFLRHIERARALVLLLDPTSMQPVGPAEQHRVLLSELAQYSDELIQRPQVAALNKVDTMTSGEASDLQAELGEDTHLVSGIRGDGLEELMGAIADAVELSERVSPLREGYVLHRPGERPFEVSREGETWVVTGRAAERAAALAQLTDPAAADHAARRLDGLGVDRALREAGARTGDEVRIGDVVFEFWEDEGEPGG